ncbi:MAG: PQQ-binding-like beta-propeller repeat protein [Thermoguttaceae bacterium]|nr:PQQ-binding-like beta-propeller repeat protein [Thermoguttaceae bacterium]
MNPIPLLLIILYCLLPGWEKTSLAADWPWWKGPTYDSKSPDRHPLPTWPADGPPLVKQTQELGTGYSNLCIFGDKIYTLGDFGDKSYLLILDRDTLKVLHKTEIGPGGSVGGFAGPKSTPTTDGVYIWAVNQNGILFCADAKAGRMIWKRNYYKDFDGAMSILKNGMYWGYAESPLLDGDRLICVPGGKSGSVVALEKTTGKLIWRSKELTDPASYASVTPVTIAGVRQYLVLTHNLVSGIGIDKGELLWSGDCSGTPLAICTDPVCVDDYVFVTRAKLGGWGYKVVRHGDRFKAELVYQLKEIDNTHHGLICVGYHVYTTSSKGAFCCFDMKTGKILWRNRAIRNMASLGYASGNLILRNERTGELTQVVADAKEYKEVGRFRPSERSDQRAWTWPIVVDGLLYVRDQQLLLVYDLQKVSKRQNQ